MWVLAATHQLRELLLWHIHFFHLVQHHYSDALRVAEPRSILHSPLCILAPPWWSCGLVFSQSWDCCCWSSHCDLLFLLKLFPIIIERIFVHNIVRLNQAHCPSSHHIWPPTVFRFLLSNQRSYSKFVFAKVMNIFQSYNLWVDSILI